MFDTSKHSMIFDPSKFKGAIAVIGLGAIGSHLTYNLAKLGLGRTMLMYDFDKVESHNIANQMYGTADIGKHKVRAMEDLIDRLTSDVGDRIPGLNRKVESKYDLHSGTTTIFCCVDSMAMRKTIFDNAVYMNPNITYFADGRMGAREGMIYGFNPSNLPKAKEYRKRWYPDEDVQDELVGGCSITPSIGATAQMVALQMTWMFMNHINQTPYQMSETLTMEPVEELAFRVDNLEVHTRGWLV